MPLRQWWYFEDVECLGGQSGGCGRGEGEGGRYAAQTALLGEEMQQKLGASKVGGVPPGSPAGTHWRLTNFGPPNIWYLVGSGWRWGLEGSGVR